jgi:hypothetical protein
VLPLFQIWPLTEELDKSTVLALYYLPVSFVTYEMQMMIIMIETSDLAAPPPLS